MDDAAGRGRQARWGRRGTVSGVARHGRRAAHKCRRQGAWGWQRMRAPHAGAQAARACLTTVRQCSARRRTAAMT